MNIKARKIPLIDMSVGGPKFDRDHDWAVWEWDSHPGCFGKTIFQAVGGYIIQVLLSNRLENRAGMARFRAALRDRFPIKEMHNAGYAERVGVFCVNEGKQFDLTISVLESKTDWGFHHVTQDDCS